MDWIRPSRRIARFVEGCFAVLSIGLVHGVWWAGFYRSERRFGRARAQIEADERLCRAHCFDQRVDAHDGHDAFEIVGQHVQGHFGADPFERLHLEVR